MSEKILVVEDEPRVVRLVSEVLGAAGYQVIAAASGGPAIEMVALEQPDLVLLDILLPHNMTPIPSQSAKGPRDDGQRDAQDDAGLHPVHPQRGDHQDGPRRAVQAAFRRRAR